MPATSTLSPTGDPYVDGVLIGVKWAVNSLTFSFPTAGSLYGEDYGYGEPDNAFAALNPVQQASVRTALAGYASVANLTFTEIVETTTQHADLRYAESDTPFTAWAYYPSPAAYGGDSWFNNSRHSYDNPVMGNYAWSTVLHETGHALGLKHPHQGMGLFGAMPADRDSLEYSVMSYRSYVGASTSSGYTNGTASFPQTLMMYDIAAVQRLYGPNYGFNAGDTVYRFDESTGEMFVNNVGQGAPAGNKIFLTVWDGGGDDTYSFANYATDLTVSLAPGGWSILSPVQLANLGSFKIATGNVANALLFGGNPLSLIENVIGGSGNDFLVGNAADNDLVGGPGSDFFDGAGGSNTVGYSGNSADYALVHNADGGWTVSDLRAGSPEGSDTLARIQWLRFSDGLLALSSVTDPAPGATNHAPEAHRDIYVTVKNTKLKVAAAGVLANDSDADGDLISAIRLTKSGKGAIALHDNGSFSFTPAKDFAGIFSFTYTANDGEVDSAVTTVRIRVAKSPAGANNGNGEHGVSEDQVPDWHGAAGFDLADLTGSGAHHPPGDSGLLFW